MNKVLKYTVDSDDFLNAGKVSDKVREELRTLGLDAEVIRRVSLALYQGEINMVIHANGGEITVEVSDNCITMTLTDKGPGISDVETAMKEGYSTAGDDLRSRGYGEGMGFTTMQKYTDEMTVHSKVGEGTSLTMKVYLNDN